MRASNDEQGLRRPRERQEVEHHAGADSALGRICWAPFLGLEERYCRPRHLDRGRAACLVGDGPHQDRLGHVHRHRGTTSTETEANLPLATIAPWQGG